MRLHGRNAIEYAAQAGLTLHKYNDPVEGAGEISPTQAEVVIRDDQFLVYVDVLPEDEPLFPISTSN